MIIEHKYNRNGRVILEATCDICGADCMKDFFAGNAADGDRDDCDNEKEFEGMILHADWGFTSNNKDCESWEAIVCEDCVDTHFKHIKFIKKYNA